jgi:hypothetical protein
MSGSLAGDRVVSHERLTSHDDKSYGRHMWGLILRIGVVVSLGMLFWQTIIDAGTP